jgi:hypothetical protein
MNASIKLPEQVKDYRGEIQIEVRDRKGQLVNSYTDHNLVKVFAKEILAHCMAPRQIWDPNANTGVGGYVDSGVSDDYFPKYIIFGASYDDTTGQPLDVQDTRYYLKNLTSNSYVPVKPDVGADNGGDLIHPVPISEPDRPLKRIETISFVPSYQPTDSPLLSGDVRAINNVLVLETVLRLNEYNGFDNTNADFFTICEVALAGGKQLDNSGVCNCPPKQLFLEGVGDANNAPITCITSGTATISIESNVSTGDAALINAGDQILITQLEGTGTEPYNTLNQVQPYYLVTAKSIGGRDLTLDRVPVDANNNPLTGNVGVFRSSLRIFSQRVLTVPFKKSSDYEISIKWIIYFA